MQDALKRQQNITDTWIVHAYEILKKSYSDTAKGTYHKNPLIWYQQTYMKNPQTELLPCPNYLDLHSRHMCQYKLCCNNFFKTLLCLHCWHPLIWYQPACMMVPPGFIFQPTDEELLDFFLKEKLLHQPLPCDIIKEADVYGNHPSNLASKCVCVKIHTHDPFFFLFCSILSVIKVADSASFSWVPFFSSICHGK